jgi:hypothetical protein
MQDLLYNIKRPNLKVMGTEEGKEIQAKGIDNISNKIITANVLNLEKERVIQVQEAFRTPNKQDSLDIL